MTARFIYAISAHMKNEPIRCRLKEAFDASGIQIKDAHQAFVQYGMNIDRSALSRMLTGAREIKANEAGVWAKILDLNIAWLLMGTQPQKLFASSAKLTLVSSQDDREGERDPMSAEADGYLEGSYRPRIKGAIPEIDVRVGAGEGSVGEVISIPIGEESYSGHAVVGEWHAPEDYIRHELNISTKKSVVMEVVGDSMIPTFLPGDRVIIDLRVKTMTQDGVYVISDGMSPPQIKRLTRILFTDPAEVEIISDNPAHRLQRAPLHDVHIIGRVAGRVTRQ